MTMLHERRTQPVPLRHADVTADDSSFNGTTFNCYDLSKQDNNQCHELDPGARQAEIHFLAEIDDNTGEFGCEIMGAPKGGPARVLFDVTGAATMVSYGPQDTSDVLVIDDLSVTNVAHLDASATKPGVGQPGIIRFDCEGIQWVYPRFYNVGDASQATRIRPYIRSW